MLVQCQLKRPRNYHHHAFCKQTNNNKKTNLQAVALLSLFCSYNLVTNFVSTTTKKISQDIRIFKRHGMVRVFPSLLAVL